MRKLHLLSAVALATLPFSATAETWNIYGYQDHSLEFVEQTTLSYACPDFEWDETQGPRPTCTRLIDGVNEPLDELSNSRDFSRIENNRSVIGFAASADTGMAGLQVNVQCENLVFVNEYSGGTGWCNRNSKFSLSSDSFGEIMFGTWLLPHNAVVAPKVDPFYDTGATAHSNIMGSVGANTRFYNTGQFESSSTGNPPGEYNAGIAAHDNGFNRMQENIVQYFSPNINGVTFRLAMTAGNRDDTMIATDINNNGMPGDSVTRPSGFVSTDAVAVIDPRIYSGSLAYENGPLWLAATYQKHDDWAAARLTVLTGPTGERVPTPVMTGSEADSYRVAARYIFDFGGNTSVQLAAMYEDLEHAFEGTTGNRRALGAFGFGHAQPHDLQDRTWGPRGLATYVDAGGGQIVLSTSADLGFGDIAFERSAWMVSGKAKFGGPVDVRFSYMEADDMDLRCAMCPATWTDSGADAWNVGVFYTMPAGTELRMTYSEVNNDYNGSYGQAITGTGLGEAAGEVEMFAVGIVHWFD